MSPGDNARLACGTQGGDAAIINWVTGETFASLTGHESAINTLDYSSDGNSLASGSDGGIVIVWDTGSGVALHTLGDKEEGHQEQVLSVAFTVNDTLLGSSSADNSIILWNFLSEQQVGKYIFGTTVWSLAFSNDGWMAAGLMDHSVVMWQLTRFVESTSPQVTLLGHQGEVLDLAFSPTTKLLATASNDGTIILWDLSQITQ